MAVMKANSEKFVSGVTVSPLETKKAKKSKAKPKPQKKAKPSKEKQSENASLNGSVTEKKDKPGFGKFASRNAVKIKDDKFSQMVKDKAVKEKLSPSFLKKLDKCIARLPNGGKRFVNWLIYDVHYKIKFLPIIEEVFKMIKTSGVLPPPSGVNVPLSAREKKRLKREKRKQAAASKGETENAKTDGAKTGSVKTESEGTETKEENVGIKRKISAVKSEPTSDNEASENDESPNLNTSKVNKKNKKKQFKREVKSEFELNQSPEPKSPKSPTSPLNASLGNNANSIKKNKKKNSLMRKSMG